MKRVLLLSCLVLGGVSVMTGAALAKGPEGGHGLMRIQFEQLDLDRSGEITLEELRNLGKVRFAAADTDDDGFLSEAELQAKVRDRVEKRTTRMMNRLDVNDDGQLSLEELDLQRGNGGRMFDRLDADNSGGISQEEYADAQDRMRKRHGGRQRD